MRQPWAAASQAKRIEHRPIDIDYVATDSAAQAHRGAPPQPDAPESPQYVELEMRADGGSVLRPAPIIEQPKPDWKPRRYVFNEHTGSYDIVNEDGNDR